MTASLDTGIVSGGLEVRLARHAAEIQEAQRLRYAVFYTEMGAQADVRVAAEQRDFDAYDDHCDHLLVIERRRKQIVGTYRLIRRVHAARLGHFYSAGEFDIGPLLAAPGEILELGRSCVAPDYRTRPTMQLLWRGIVSYVFDYNISLLFGCASLPGTDPQALALPLSYLHYHHLAPPALRATALPGRYVDMRLLPPERVQRTDDAEVMTGLRVFSSLPPLIKGYLRVGAYVGDGAVVDHQFNTTDVCIIVKTDLITDKYLRHYERGAAD